MFAMRAGKKLSFPSIRLKETNSRSSKTAPSAADPTSCKFTSTATAACGPGRSVSSLVATLAKAWGILLLGLISPCGVQAQSIPRYQALLQNGQRLQGKALSDWHEPN